MLQMPNKTHAVVTIGNQSRTVEMTEIAPGVLVGAKGLTCNLIWRDLPAETVHAAPLPEDVVAVKAEPPVPQRIATSAPVYAPPVEPQAVPPLPYQAPRYTPARPSDEDSQKAILAQRYIEMEKINRNPSMAPVAVDLGGNPIQVSQAAPPPAMPTHGATIAPPSAGAPSID